VCKAVITLRAAQIEYTDT